jgi:hypothetical protein
MTLARAQVVFPMFTNIPRDVITNTFHFLHLVADLPTMADAITPELSDMYDALYGATFGIAAYTSPTLATVRWYDMAEPEPRVPYILPLGLTATVETASIIPTEVAAVLSFQAEPESGVPQSRRRNRIYLGGLTGNHVSTATGDNFPSISTTFRGAAATALPLNLITQLESSGNVWVVRSPTYNITAPVVSGWIDNAPDTQRRRSIDSTARTLWP